MVLEQAPLGAPARGEEGAALAGEEEKGAQTEGEGGPALAVGKEQAALGGVTGQ